MVVTFRDARVQDLPAIIALLSDDPLGRSREGGPQRAYEKAFDQIEAQPNQWLIVGETEGWIVATCQLTILPGFSQRGTLRAIVENVRTTAELRGQGIGAALMAECERRAKAQGASVLQLVAHQSRSRAHRFYERLGFEPSHIGFRKGL